ncbi:MAG: fatty acid desaturase [Myxococcota bacterium]
MSSTKEAHVAFVVVDVPDPHPARGRRLAAAHPELRQLFGRNPWTAALVAGLVALQLGVAAALGWTAAPWWAVLAAAWLVGAFVDHALFAAMHDAAHGLVFRRRWANDLVVVLANTPMLVPFGFPFAYWHLEHHRHQGDPARDPDLPAPWELRVFPEGFVGKLAWHVSFVGLQVFRTHAGGPSIREPRVAAHALFALAVAAVITVGLGPAALGYLVASLYFVYSLHPLAGRFVQEHHLMPGAPVQETASYVGPLNLVSLNFGLHTEHHDFPAVPWNRLPAIRRIAPEGYADRQVHRSWTALWLRFLFEPGLSHASRAIRVSPAHRTAAGSGDQRLEPPEVLHEPG